MFKNKKAEEEGPGTDMVPFGIVFVIMLGFTAIFFVLIMESFGTKMIIIPPSLEDYILEERFFSSCFLFNDDKEGILPDTIDYNRFSQDRLNTCYSAKNKPAYRLTLKTSYTNTINTLQSSNWINGEAATQGSSFDVKVFKDNNIIKGVIEIETQTFK